MKQPRDWTEQQIKYYYGGIKYSDYPQVFWDMMLPHMEGASTLIDIGCGPGAFALTAAAAGLKVQAVDISSGNLKALREQIKYRQLSNIEIVHADWLEAVIKKSEVAVCAYSFGGSIGTLEGVKKIIASTEKVAFLVSPCERERGDFLSKELYVKCGITPSSFSGDHRDILGAFEKLQQPVKWEIVAYDFGMPIESRDEIKPCAIYLADKLGLPDVDLVEKHIKSILTVRKGLYWVPNPKKSAIITWQRRDMNE